MTIATNAGFDGAAAAPVLGVLHLVEMDFLSGTQYLTNWPVNLTVGAKSYTGLGALGRVGELKESEDGAVQSVDLELSQVNASFLALALGSVNGYQGKAVRIYEALTSPSLAILGTPVLRFAGWMDIVKIKRDENGNVGRITMVCKTGGYDVRKNPAGLRMNDAQHQANHPGELGMQFVADLIGRPQQWLSKRFQTV